MGSYAPFVILCRILAYSACLATGYGGPRSTESPGSTTGTPPLPKSSFNLGVLPKEFLERKIMFICTYSTDKEAKCQQVTRCDDTMHTTKAVDTGDAQKTLFIHNCEGVDTTVSWEVEDGLIKREMADGLFAGTSDQNAALFACTFFSQADTPKKDEAPPTARLQLFECTNPRDCNISRSETNCASPTPWSGTWSGNLTSGLRGKVTGTSMEDSMQDEP